MMLRPGIYRRPNTDTILRVRLNRLKTRVYSERWTQIGAQWKFVYEPAALDTLGREDLMPLEEARRISREAGQCLACARMLTEPESQAAGIGPSCAKSWTYAHAEGVVQRNIEASFLSPKRTIRARAVGDRIVVTSAYDTTIIGIIKSFDGARWDGAAFAWSLPIEHALALAEAFSLVGIPHEEMAAIAMGWIT